MAHDDLHAEAVLVEVSPGDPATVSPLRNERMSFSETIDGVVIISNRKDEDDEEVRSDEQQQEHKAAQTERLKQRVKRVLFAHMFLNVSVICLPIQARPALLRSLTRGDAAKAASILAALTSSVGLAEFVVNPVVGGLSDAHGRLPFLLLSPLASLALKTFTWQLLRRGGGGGGGGKSSNGPGCLSAAGVARLLALERIVCGALSTVSGSTLCSAVLSDVFTDEVERAAASAQLGACAGVGVILGPMLGGLLLARGSSGGGGPRGGTAACFGAAAALAAAQLALVATRMPETLPPGPRRRAMRWSSAVSPLAFTKLFTGSTTLRRLALILGMQCVPEGKNISDLNQIYLSTECGFSPLARTRWLMAFGLAMIAGGGVAKRMIGALGTRRFTTLANGGTAAAFALWGAVPAAWSLWTGLALLVPGMERRACLGSIAVDHATSGNNAMGKAEYAAAFANWRALMVVAAPQLYARVYAAARGAGRSGGLAYWAGAAVVLCAEALHRSIPDCELFKHRRLTPTA